MLSTKFKLVPFGQPYNSNPTANQIRFWHIEEGGTREFRRGGGIKVQSPGKPKVETAVYF